MKIEPKHDIKKPAYAIGMAVLATTLLTGCPGIKKEAEELRTAGVAVVTPASEESSSSEEEFVLAGDVAIENFPEED